MTKLTKSIVTASVLFTGSAFATQFITIGTGGVTGTYYPTGGAICRMMNKNKKKTGIRCSVESTGGSVYNVNTINANELDFGIAQSDTAYQAFNGEGKFKGKAIKGLRSVIAIYPELLAFVITKKSGIKKLTDIKGKKANIDVAGSGTRMTTEVVLMHLVSRFQTLLLPMSSSHLKVQPCSKTTRSMVTLVYLVTQQQTSKMLLTL